LEDEICKKLDAGNAYIMGVDQASHPGNTELNFYWAGKGEFIKENKRFSSHSSLFDQWSINSILDFLRRKFN
jgi:hypothetical protein